MGPDPTLAYFWPAVNKRPTRLRPMYFLTQSGREKLKNFGFLGEIFQTQTQTKDGWPDQTQPEQQKSWPGPITTTHILYLPYISCLFFHLERKVILYEYLRNI